MKSFILILILLLFTGCSKSSSAQPEATATQLAESSITEPTNEPEINDNAKENELFTYGIQDVQFEYPSNWKLEEQDGIVNIYPESGGLLFIQKIIDNTLLGMELTDSQNKEIVDAVFSGTKKNSINYENKENMQTVIFENTLAFVANYYCDYNSIRYENLSYTFIYNNIVYCFVLAQPDSLTSTDEFEAVINSLSVASATNDSSSVSQFDITSGDLYESIIDIHPTVSLRDVNGSLHININIDKTSPKKECESFFNILDKIIKGTKVEDSYSFIAFNMKIDDTFITTLALVDYLGPDNFTTTEPSVMDVVYEEYILDKYNSYFSNNDISNNFDKNLDELSEKYNLDN